MYPGCSVRTATSIVYGSNLFSQGDIGLRPRRWPAVQPCVVASGRHPQHATQLSDRIVRLLRRDEPIAAHRVVSFAKKGCRFFQDVTFLAQHPVFMSEAAQLLAFGGCQAVASASINIGLGHP